MNTPRLSKLSKENLLVADSVRFDQINEEDNYMIRVSRNGNVAYLQSGKGYICFYDLKAAYRVVKTHRPDLKPTTI